MGSDSVSAETTGRAALHPWLFMFFPLGESLVGRLIDPFGCWKNATLKLLHCFFRLRLDHAGSATVFQ